MWISNGADSPLLRCIQEPSPVWGHMALLQVLPEEPVLCCGCTAGVTAASWYLAAGGSLSMLPDTSNWGFSIMSPSMFRWLGATVTLLSWLLGYPIPMHALQDFEQPCSGMQAPLGKADPPCSVEHSQIFSSPCAPLPCSWSPGSCRPHGGARWAFCKHVCRSTSPASLRHGFWGGGRVALSLFASTPQAVFALLLFS